MSATAQRPTLPTVLIAGGIILTLAMGIRHGFGFWQLPMVQANGWTRGTFAFALAVQNLMWGLTQPFAGMIADRYGAMRVLVAGALLYAAGLALMSVSSSGWTFTLTAGVLIGVALSGTTYSILYGVIGRVATEAERSAALGVAAAAGSFGQFIMVPIEQGLIGHLGWQESLWLLSLVALAMAPLAWQLRERGAAVVHGGPHQSVGAAIREAFAHGSFRWLMAGYFVCGFQVVFIGVHLPAYLKDHGMAPELSVWSLALIGLFNIFGTYTAGRLGARWPKRLLLSGIYFWRAVIIAVFLLLPLSDWSVYVFSACIGFLWLSTVPLTNGVIATIFGVRYLGMLSGFVFFSHQVGSFFGVWAGGYLYDRLGNYNLVWLIAIALGVFAGLANLPIRERAIERVQVAPA
jgi:MFS family permease